MAIFDFVQKAGVTDPSNIQVVTVPALGTVTTGNLLLVAITADDVGAGRHVTSIADDSGANTYVKAVGPIRGHASGGLSNYVLELWYALNVTGHAAPRVFVTYDAAFAGEKDVSVAEYVGSASVEFIGADSVSSHNVANATTPGVVSSDSQTLVFGVDVANNVGPTAGSGFTGRFNTAQDHYMEDKVVAAGTYTASWVNTTDDFIAEIAVFGVPGGTSHAGPLVNGALIKSLIGKGLVN